MRGERDLIGRSGRADKELGRGRARRSGSRRRYRRKPRRLLLMQKVSSCGSRRARAGSIFGMRFSVWTYGEPNARRAANGSVLAETFTPRTELWVCNDGRTGHGDGRRVGWRPNAGQHVGGYARRARLYSRRACSACWAPRRPPVAISPSFSVPSWLESRPRGAPILSARIGRDLTHARRHYDRRRRTRADSASRDASN